MWGVKGGGGGWGDTESERRERRVHRAEGGEDGSGWGELSTYFPLLSTHICNCFTPRPSPLLDGMASWTKPLGYQGRDKVTTSHFCGATGLEKLAVSDETSSRSDFSAAAEVEGGGDPRFPKPTGLSSGREDKLGVEAGIAPPIGAGLGDTVSSLRMTRRAAEPDTASLTFTSTTRLHMVPQVDDEIKNSTCVRARACVCVCVRACACVTWYGRQFNTDPCI